MRLELDEADCFIGDCIPENHISTQYKLGCLVRLLLKQESIFNWAEPPNPPTCQRIPTTSWQLRVVHLKPGVSIRAFVRLS